MRGWCSASRKEVPATISMHFPILIMKFAKPVDVAVDRLNAGAPRYISAARIDPDGSAIRIALAHKLKVHSIPAAEKLFVDLLPQTWGTVMPGLPQEVIEDLARRAREAERLLHRKKMAARQRKPQRHQGAGGEPADLHRATCSTCRTASTWCPSSKDGRLMLDFDQKIKWDLADAIATMPPTLKSIGATVDVDLAAVNFVFNGSPKVRTFREDSSIAVDVATGEAASKREGAIVPGIAPPQTVPAEGEAPAKKADAGRGFAEDRAKPEAPPAAAEAEAKPATQADGAQGSRGEAGSETGRGRQAARKRSGAAKPAPRRSRPPTMAAAAPQAART